MKRNPHTQFDYTIANTKELLTLLEDGKIDFAITDYDLYHEFNLFCEKIVHFMSIIKCYFLFCLI